MDTSKNATVRYGIGTNDMVQYYKGTVNSISLQYYLINFVVKNHDQDPGQSIVNDNFTVVSILKK